MKRVKDDLLPVEKIIREFEREEAKPGGRKGAFKIDAPFDEALGRILSAKPPDSKSIKK